MSDPPAVSLMVRGWIAVLASDSVAGALSVIERAKVTARVSDSVPPAASLAVRVNA